LPRTYQRVGAIERGFQPQHWREHPSWDFGDGNTSTATNPANIMNAGSYTVKLTAIGVGGTNTLTRANYIIVTNVPPPSFQAPLWLQAPLPKLDSMGPGGSSALLVGMSAMDAAQFQIRTLP
jgi:hypothetical protein